MFLFLIILYFDDFLNQIKFLIFFEKLTGKTEYLNLSSKSLKNLNIQLERLWIPNAHWRLLKIIL